MPPEYGTGAANVPFGAPFTRTPSSTLSAAPEPFAHARSSAPSALKSARITMRGLVPVAYDTAAPGPVQAARASGAAPSSANAEIVRTARTSRARCVECMTLPSKRERGAGTNGAVLRQG
ncbi:MAG: hypothetical protein U0704_18420 [Candidatus Eisenbacteria bacterium]